MFVIVRIGNKQFKVKPQDVIVVDRMAGEVGDIVEFTDVLLVGDDKKVTVGKPTVQGSRVTAKIIKQERGEKIEIRRFKSKVRYRRARGFRADLTRLEVTAVA